MIHIIDVEFNWGFSSKQLYSLREISFLYPPFSSFLGAIANVIAKEKGIPEREGIKLIKELSDKTKALSFRPLNFIPIQYSDINRIVTIKKTSGNQYPDPKDLGKSFSRVSMGKTIFISIDENPPTLRYFWYVDGDYENYLYKINRIGSKESVVNVYDVKTIDESEIEFLEEGTVNYAYPIEGVKEEKLNGEWGYEFYIDIKSYDEFLMNSTIKLYRIPIMSVKNYYSKLIPKENYVIIKYKEESLLMKK